MSYTRKPPQTRHVTFTVPWIEEPVRIVTVGSLPFEISRKAKEDDNIALVFNTLPDEISVLLETASNDEVQQFLYAWGSASDEDDKDARRTESMFERLIRGLS